MKPFEKATRQRRNNAAVAAILAENERQAKEIHRQVMAMTPEERKAKAKQDIKDIWGLD